MIQTFKAQFRDMPYVTLLEAQTQEFSIGAEGVKAVFMGTTSAAYLAKVAKKHIGYAIVKFDQFEGEGKGAGTIWLNSIGTHREFLKLDVSRKLVDKVALEAHNHASYFPSMKIVLPSYVIEDKDDPWNVEEWLWKLGFKAVGTKPDAISRYNQLFEAYTFEKVL